MEKYFKEENEEEELKGIRKTIADAIQKHKNANTAIAVYDTVDNKVYLEYPDGTRKEVL